MTWVGGVTAAAVATIALVIGWDWELPPEAIYLTPTRETERPEITESRPSATSVPEEASCEEWNTRNYFVAATAEDVIACLDAGANLEARGVLGLTPLHWAAFYSKHPAMIEAMIEAGASLEARDNIGLTPLHWAEDPAVIKALLAAGANPEARDENGSTPLHWATTGHSYLNQARRTLGLPMVWGGVIEALLDAGADLEARDSSGRTPLHWAAQFSPHPEAVEALLDAGADAKAQTSIGSTPWDLAKSNDALQGSNAYWRLIMARY